MNAMHVSVGNQRNYKTQKPDKEIKQNALAVQEFLKQQEKQRRA
jgi:hypothetical protein